MRGRTILVKFDEIAPDPGKSRLSANRVRPIGYGKVVDRGHQVEITNKMYELGGNQSGYWVWVNVSRNIGDDIHCSAFCRQVKDHLPITTPKG